MAVVGKRAAPYLFLAPTLVLGAVFFVVPLLVSLGLSFTKWDSLSPPRFVGWANYAYLLTRDPLFYESLWNMARFVGGAVLFGVPLALVLAIAFRRSRLKTLWRSAFWLPMVTNIVAVAYVWQFLLADPYGLVNRLLGFVGIVGPPWLSSPEWAMSAIVIIYVWFHLGQDMMLLSAGLDAVDPAVEEAAEMDGAGPLRRYWYVTLPMISPTLLLVLMTNLVKGAGYFALMLILTDGGPANTTNVAALHIYHLAFANLRLGMSAAAAYILMALVMMVLLVQFRLMRRGGLEAW
jgi:multiple sugar transport system permease protein